ncbi:DUF6531 domain-containing protein [Sorangium sp. So ce1000]|uniref:DUF6531 domain-containing protein n=1 Tax=Sorangium sp. So ce1000 TaxID=3133325 RepID=UPI003F5FF2B5
MARTAPVPNIPAIPGMNPGTFILGGGGGGGGGGGRGGRGRGGDQGAGGKGGGKGPRGGGKNAGACGPGSGGGCPNPSHGRGGGTSAGDPVDPVTGRVYTAKAMDLALGGMILPLRIERSYSSETSDVDLGLGFGWSHSLAWAIEERRRTLLVLEPHAAPTEAEIPEPGRPVPMPCGLLRRHEGGYTLEAEGVLLVFGERQESRWLLSRIVDRYDNEIRLSYERGRLSHAIDAVGRMVRVRRYADGRIAAFEVNDESAGGGCGFNDPLTGNKRTPDQLHPAVQAALPPSNVRGPTSRTPSSGCAEPWALSRHLDDWESRNAPKTCRPEDPRWRDNLKSALGEINPRGGIASAEGDLPRASCPNCSQTIPRLWALAGQMPPNGVIAPGYQGKRRRGPVGPTTDPAPLYFHHQSSNHLASTSAYGDRQLGTWSHGENGWKRRPQR